MGFSAQTTDSYPLLPFATRYKRRLGHSSTVKNHHIPAFLRCNPHLVYNFEIFFLYIWKNDCNFAHHFGSGIMAWIFGT